MKISINHHFSIQYDKTIDHFSMFYRGVHTKDEPFCDFALFSHKKRCFVASIKYSRPEMWINILKNIYLQSQWWNKKSHKTSNGFENIHVHTFEQLPYKCYFCGTYFAGVVVQAWFSTIRHCLVGRFKSQSMFLVLTCRYLHSNHRRRIQAEETAKVVAAVWGTELIQFLVTLDIFHQDDFEEKYEYLKGYLVKWMLWKNGWSSGSHHTKPPPVQNGCSPQNFFQIILAAKLLVQH